MNTYTYFNYPVNYGSWLAEGGLRFRDSRDRLDRTAIDGRPTPIGSYWPSIQGYRVLNGFVSAPKQ